MAPRVRRTNRVAHCPFMPVFGAAVDHVRTRAAAPNSGTSTASAISTSSAGIAVVVARPRQPGDRRSDRRPGPSPAARLATSSPTRSPPRRRSTVERPARSRRPGRRGQMFFCNSGAEANECAIKLARKYGGRGRHTVVSALGSFHGRTLATLAATGQPTKHEPFLPMPEGFRHVAWGDLDAHARPRSTARWRPS